MIWLIGLCLGGGVVLILLGFFQVQQEATETTAAKLARLRDVSVRTRKRREVVLPDDAALEFARQEEQKAAGRRTTSLPSLSSIVTGFRPLARLEENLVQIRSNWRASELMAMSVVGSLLFFILLQFMGFGLLAIPLALGCLAIPWIYARSARFIFYRKFDEQLADVLLLMANSLKAGFSFYQSMEMVARESQPPLSDEFHRVTQEVAVGVPVAEALQAMTTRINSMELNLMVTAVLIQREVGGGLAELLEVIAAVIRERVRIKGEIRVLTTQGRATGFVLSLLPIILGLVLHLVSKAEAPYEPSFIEPLLYKPQGQIMLAVALAMELMGIFFISRIVSIRV